jgi:hypothetical protein
LILKKKFYMGQGYSGERCGPWTPYLKLELLFPLFVNLLSTEIHNLFQYYV